MGLGLVLRQTAHLAQSLRLTSTQRILIQESALTIRLELIEALRGSKYEPRGDCPRCNRKMSPFEIIKGFNNDPKDYTTECTGCHYRFEPKMVAGVGQYSTAMLPFFCSMQTLDQMRSIQPVVADQFMKEHPAVYHSAIVHHGGLRQAYAKIGIQYPYEEITDWRKKIKDFLGRVPDTLIAKAVDKSVKTIREMRKRDKVPAYNVHRALKEVSVT